MNFEQEVQEALFDVIDPELGINIVDLGLVYGVYLDENQNVKITMTLTTPGCPMHDSIANGIKYRLALIEGINDIDVELVWEPAWSPEKMSERAREILWG